MAKKKDSNSKPSNWRGIQQRFSGRAVTTHARKRRWMINLKILGVVVVFAALCGAGYAGIQYLQSESFARLMAGGSEPVRNVYLQSDGVLDEQWLNERISLPKNIELMAVDIDAIQRDLAEDGQVRSVLVERVFPDSLRIRVTERQPVLRMVLQDASGRKFLRLISREGDIYAGKCYPADTIRSMPFVSGVALQRKGMADYEPLEGVGPVADFLQRARALMPERWQHWNSISLERYDPEGLSHTSSLVVTTDSNMEIIFSPNDVDEQLARLEAILSRVESQRRRVHEVDLTLQDPVVRLAESGTRGPVRFR